MEISNIQKVYATVVMKNKKKLLVISIDRKRSSIYDSSLYFENIGPESVGYARKLEVFRKQKLIESYEVINLVLEEPQQEPGETFRFKNPKGRKSFGIKTKDLKVGDSIVFEWGLGLKELEFLKEQFDSNQNSTNNLEFRGCVHMFFIQRVALCSNADWVLQRYFTLFLQSI